MADEDDVLTEEHLRKALEISCHFPMKPPPLPLHAAQWENYKECFGLTDEEMNKYFIKVEYIP